MFIIKVRAIILILLLNLTAIIGRRSRKMR